MTDTPPAVDGAPVHGRLGAGNGPERTGSRERYRRLPTGAHGLDREEVERDQRERLQRAMTELIAERGYQAVRILDLTKLAHVSRPTFYELYRDKEELLISAYNEIAARTANTVFSAFDQEGPIEERIRSSMHALADLTVSEPHAVSLFLLGAFGAGPKALARRKQTVAALERAIQSRRERSPNPSDTDLTVKFLIGGIREVAVSRMHHERTSELPALADELICWVSSYPLKPPRGLQSPPPPLVRGRGADPKLTSERARRAQGRLPSGRHDLSREDVVNSQRERIVDATAEIVAEKGLASLTIPEIASRANVSHETFYEMYPTKQDAFLETQKMGMYQAFAFGVADWEAQMPDWPRAITAALRAVITYLVSEPALAHVAIVDAFGASPETIQARDEILHALAQYYEAGFERAPSGLTVPAIAYECVVGGCWQVMHHYIDSGRIDELPAAAPQITYMTLVPFIGAKQAARVALLPPSEFESSAPAA